MTWDEFSTLLCGLGADSPLCRIVRIRSEKDGNVLKSYTPEQHRIRNDWIARHRSSGNASEQIIRERDEFLKRFAEMFK